MPRNPSAAALVTSSRGELLPMARCHLCPRTKGNRASTAILTAGGGGLFCEGGNLPPVRDKLGEGGPVVQGNFTKHRTGLHAGCDRNATTSCDVQRAEMPASHVSRCKLSIALSWSNSTHTHTHSVLHDHMILFTTGAFTCFSWPASAICRQDDDKAYLGAQRAHTHTHACACTPSQTHMRTA